MAAVPKQSELGGVGTVRRGGVPAQPARQIIIRHIRQGEILPPELHTGFANSDVDWCWVADFNRRPMGVLLAAPAHGAVFAMRLVVASYAPKATAYRLLKAAGREVKAKGYPTMFTFLAAGRPNETRLLGIMRKMPHRAIEATGIWVSVPVDALTREGRHRV